MNKLNTYCGSLFDCNHVQHWILKQCGILPCLSWKIPVSTASKVCSKGTSTNYNWFSHTNLKIVEGAESCHSHVPYLHQCDSVVSTKSQHFTPTISCKHSQAWAWKKVGQTSKKAGGGPRIVIQMNNSYCLISSWYLLFLITMFTTQMLSLRAEIT